MGYRSNINLKLRLGFLPVMALLASCSQEPSKGAHGPNKEICAKLNSTIDRNIVDIAISNSAGDDVDKSAMQQSARAQDNENRLSVIMINVQLQAQNSCAPREKPIDPTLYGKSASNCHTTRLLERSVIIYRRDPAEIAIAEKKTAEACDFSKWTPQE
jgi:hypothetical protein